MEHAMARARAHVGRKRERDLLAPRAFEIEAPAVQGLVARWAMRNPATAGLEATPFPRAQMEAMPEHGPGPKKAGLIVDVGVIEGPWE